MSFSAKEQGVKHSAKVQFCMCLSTLVPCYRAHIEAYKSDRRGGVIAAHVIRFVQWPGRKLPYQVLFLSKEGLVEDAFASPLKISVIYSFNLFYTAFIFRAYI